MTNKSVSLWAFNIKKLTMEWDDVYTKELPRIYNFFLYKTADREYAQDLTAETFERAWKKRSSYKPLLASLPTWLFGIARNVFKEYLRGVGKSDQHHVDLSQLEESSSGFDLEENIQHYQDKQRLHKLLLELSDREQDLIALKYGAGLTNREIARITRLTESNVGSILHRSVTVIREKWEE
jgi:RNA polymerase sigma-70 factor (ECF subfamily)